jgi:hypothetical protein
MALWQFIVIAVLIGALLVYAGVLANRIGCTNATLKRIEEALLVTDGPMRHAATRAAEVARSPEVSGIDGDASYLTIRDLKVSSRVTRSSSEKSVAMSPESRDALKMRIELMSSPGSRPANGNPIATSSESRDALSTSGELLSSPGTFAANENPIATSSESRDALSTSSEPPSSPGTCAVNGDLVAKKKRDALLILGSQRRRRRAREGY